MAHNIEIQGQNQIQYVKQIDDFKSPSFDSDKQTENCSNISNQCEQNSHYIGEKEQAPLWLIDNDHLYSGYRINFSTHKQIWKSVLMLHNDTMNIWTHTLGAVFSLWLFIYEIQSINDQSVILTKFPLYLVLVAYFFMFAGSAYLHIYICHSEKTNRCVLKADYCGIAQLGAAKGIAFIYYGLYCSEPWNTIYLTIWSIMWSVLFILSVTNKFHAPKYKSIKVALYVATGFFIAIPLIHVLILGNQGNYSPWYPIGYLFSYVSSLLLGVVLTFVLQFPEKKFKYTFDYFGASHQLWHICVIIDFILTYYGTYSNYNQRMEQLQC